MADELRRGRRERMLRTTRPPSQREVTRTFSEGQEFMPFPYSFIFREHVELGYLTPIGFDAGDPLEKSPNGWWFYVNDPGLYLVSLRLRHHPSQFDDTEEISFWTYIDGWKKNDGSRPPDDEAPDDDFGAGVWFGATQLEEMSHRPGSADHHPSTPGSTYDPYEWGTVLSGFLHLYAGYEDYSWRIFSWASSSDAHASPFTFLSWDMQYALLSPPLE